MIGIKTHTHKFLDDLQRKAFIFSSRIVLGVEPGSR